MRSNSEFRRRGYQNSWVSGIQDWWSLHLGYIRKKKLENTYNWLNGPPKGFWLNRSKENNRNLDFCCSHRWMFFESITLGKMLTRLFLVSNTSSLLSLVSLIVLLPLFLHKPNFQFPDPLPSSSEMCSQLTSWKEEWEAFFCS